MNVWIWSNKARVAIVAECNGMYANAYLGQLRRFSLPGENPWPLACLTDGYTSLWQYTTWHDAAASTGSRDADQHRRNLASCGGARSPWEGAFPLITPAIRFAGRTAYGLRISPFGPTASLAGVVERL